MAHRLSFLYLFIICFSFGCSNLEPNDPELYQILPEPVQLTPKSGQFILTADTKIVLTSKTQKLQQVTRYLSRLLKPATGFNLEISNDPGEANIILFSLDNNINHPEGYILDISPHQVLIRARQAVGAFYAVQSLRQLLPPEIESKEMVESAEWRIPCATIEDAPRYAYRGMHLDVGRHFFPIEFIRKYIDMLALHKMNYFHWHLTEDQGWRIEIKKYPKLQEIASQRKETLVGHNRDKPQKFDGQPYGGFYTQEEIQRLVFYAQSRFVNIIPEIEMPGHSQAALAAYPNLGCTNGPFETATKWGVFKEVYCPKEETFQFLEDVLEEVFALFPGKYIHIGGDECPKDRWKESQFCQNLIKKEGLKDEHELQSYFIKRMEKFINANGKSLIGWDEILEGGLAPNATVMSWRGTEGGIAAAKQGHDVIMTPTSHCYFDYYQAKPEGEPLAIGGFLPLDTVYSFEPTPIDLSLEEQKHILGAQGNLWTEYIKTPEQLEYMAFPRAIALAEVVWSPKEKRNFASFKKRLKHHSKRLDQLNVNYGKHHID